PPLAVPPKVSTGYGRAASSLKHRNRMKIFGQKIRKLLGASLAVKCGCHLKHGARLLRSSVTVLGVRPQRSCHLFHSTSPHELPRSFRLDLVSPVLHLPGIRHIPSAKIKPCFLQLPV